VRIKVKIAVQFRKLTQNRSVLYTEGTTLDEVLKELCLDFPGLREKIYDEDGNRNKALNIYINREDISHLGDRPDRLEPDDEIYILPPASGG
jgi:molybdopterin synthase sulfur carrier subunit